MDKKRLAQWIVELAWPTGIAVVIAFLTVTSLPKLNIVVLVVVTGACFTVGVFGQKWIKPKRDVLEISKAIVMLAVIWGGATALGWKLWPVKSFCYIKPVSEGISGVVLAMNNSGFTSIQDVSFAMTEIPEGKLIQSCKVGTVVGNQRLFVLPPCQAFFQIKNETQWQFEIHTNDDIFMEYVTVQPSNFSSTCKMTSYSEKTQILNGECP